MITLTLQLPDALLARVREAAARANVTTEEYLTKLIDASSAADLEWTGRVERGHRVSPERFRSILAKAQNVDPVDGD